LNDAHFPIGPVGPGWLISCSNVCVSSVYFEAFVEDSVSWLSSVKKVRSPLAIAVIMLLNSQIETVFANLLRRALKTDNRLVL
jgi:hypothetical protein